MNILILVAGTNEPSNSAYLAEKAAEELRNVHECNVDLVRLKDLEIDHFSVDCYQDSYVHEPDFLHVQKLVQAADGVLIASPIWNFGVPAHLKNLLDRMGSFALDETRSKGTLAGKPFYFVYTGGAPLPAWTGMMSKTTSFIQEGVRYFGGSPVGTFFEGKCTKGRGAFDLVVHERPETLERLQREMQKFGSITTTYAETGNPPVTIAAKGKVMKIGERILKAVTGA